MSVEDCFRPVFKYYKQRSVKPCFKDVVDFENPPLENVSSVPCQVATNIQHLGLKDTEKWNIYYYDNVPGLYFIPNPFTNDGSIMWINRCVQDYCNPPNKSNIPDQSSTLWKDTCGQIQSYSEESFKTNSSQLKVLRSCPIWKLRWSTLGLHHDWDSKVYSSLNCSEFPSELNDLIKIFASSIGFRDYKSQAAIVNFYHVGSTLSPHTDHSEDDLTKPLISVSFGLPAIFLIGGTEKSCPPTPIFIRSGDVLIMSGPSRLAYHAVPRIMESESECFRNDPIELFKAHSRININVRQFKS